MTNLVAKLMADRPTDWLAVLENEYKIKASWCEDRKLVSLKYNQIESPMNEPVVQQCRGMVVDTQRCQVVAWPYNKFWNHGEGLAASIDWSTAQVQEKLDGSLMILYWLNGPNGWLDDTGKWYVASSGHPVAGGSFGTEARTFGEAFWDTWNALGYSLIGANQCMTYMFEFCATPNRVVVRYEQPRIVLHGVRHNITGEEYGADYGKAVADSMGCEYVRSFPISSIQDCLKAAEELDPISQEGFVVVDGAFNRVKIKSPRYVILHHMKGDATPRRAIELWQTGETQELLTHFPEMAAQIQPVQNDLDEIARLAILDYQGAPQTSRKDFALAVKDLQWSAVLFRILTDKLEPTVDTAKRVMRNLHLAALERMLEGFTATLGDRTATITEFIAKKALGELEQTVDREIITELYE